MTSTDTQTVHLIGGPLDGEAWDDVPSHCIELYADTDAPAPRQRYRYCCFSSARFGKQCFIHQSIDHDFYAR